MNTTIQLITEPLYHKPLSKQLYKEGYRTQIVKLEEWDGGFNSSTNQLLFVQSHLWSYTKQYLARSGSIIMFGLPTWLFCWLNIIEKHSSAYITPLDTLITIKEAVDQVEKGSCYLSNSIKGLLETDKKNIHEQFLNRSLTSYLTQSELEILVLVGEGFTTSEIAKKRFRSVHTIKTQRKKIRQKINAVNRERLAVFAGRKVYALKTLLLIEEKANPLNEILKNTS